MLGLDFGVSSVERSGLTLSGALHYALKGGAWRRRMGQKRPRIQAVCLPRLDSHGFLAGKDICPGGKGGIFWLKANFHAGPAYPMETTPPLLGDRRADLPAPGSRFECSNKIPMQNK